MLDKNFQIGIIGLGLIGGSIAKALSKKGYEVFADDLLQKTIEDAQNQKAILGSLNQINKNKDFIILFALPVLSLSKELEKYSAILSKAVLVTDCLSVKKDFKKILDEKNLDTSNFVMSHPIAGSEKSGFKNSTPDLFKNRISVLTKLADTSESAFQICLELWSEVGSSSIELSIEKHDKFFALTSHLPHLIAFSLISAVSEINPGSANLLSGGGLKDFTRIASSDPKMWEDIFLSNKENILESLESFKKEMNKIESFIKSSDAEKINEIIKSAKLYRDSLS